MKGEYKFLVGVLSIVNGGNSFRTHLLLVAYQISSAQETAFSSELFQYLFLELSI